ncbi:hypothetical protein HDV00_012643 [Rhizophlyctis rosea]|nr:hypothetical protein HDV00_012643 [Rhizophlyctis rosea]
MVAIKVLNSTGEGSVSDLLSGLQWMDEQTQSAPTVAYIGLVTERSSILNRVVDTFLAKGIIVVVPSGNLGGTACDNSPASANLVLTVAATNISDGQTAFSATGSCVDLFAPGADIPGISSDGTPTTQSGTSISAAFVAGAIAVQWSRNSTASAAELLDQFGKNATKDVVQGITFFDAGDTPNLLVYSIPE